MMTQNKTSTINKIPVIQLHQQLSLIKAHYNVQVLLTPDFGTCQGRVLQRRKGSASYDRWVWRGDRMPWSKILLTKEEEVDQIFWHRFGKSYLIFRIVYCSLR